MVLLAVFLVFWSFVASRTRFGRHVYAVGGSAEAARRAGINVDRVRIAVFMIAGFMAGLGGIILASRLRSVATEHRRRQPLAERHRGRRHRRHQPVRRAGSRRLGPARCPRDRAIANGMGLLNLNPGTKFMITGLVLLAAVLVDSLSKRRRAARGVV